MLRTRALLLHYHCVTASSTRQPPEAKVTGQFGGRTGLIFRPPCHVQILWVFLHHGTLTTIHFSAETLPRTPQGWSRPRFCSPPPHCQVQLAVQRDI
ncbi:hypothetical protein JZ751_007561 [Albula glossodonta]|uniref:Uncharacterized protein n=1 Tax=Albula glossodonta TaxID=121402 RepID=A0A8T2N9I6_9TELE|nr:hypothetical protein JZ751_007561 [Albula glossodonta]